MRATTSGADGLVPRCWKPVVGARRSFARGLIKGSAFLNALPLPLTLNQRAMNDSLDENFRDTAMTDSQAENFGDTAMNMGAMNNSPVENSRDAATTKGGQCRLPDQELRDRGIQHRHGSNSACSTADAGRQTDVHS